MKNLRIENQIHPLAILTNSVFLKSNLAHGLKRADPYTDGEIQASDLRTDRNANELIGVHFVERIGKPLRFAAVNQHIARTIINGLVAFRRFFREKEIAVPLGQLFTQSVPVCHDLPIEKLPVIQTGPFQISVGNLKPHGAYKPQFRAESHASATHRAGIMRNLWLE